MIATGTSSFLFLLRVQAVYSHSKLVRYIFFILWLVQVGLSILIPLGVSLFLIPLRAENVPTLPLVRFDLIIWHWLLRQHWNKEICCCSRFYAPLLRHFGVRSHFIPTGYEARKQWRPLSLADILFWKSSATVIQGHAAGWSTVLFVKSDLPKSRKLLTFVSRLTVGINVTTVALLGSSSIPQILQIISAVPGIALTSIMACNAQRNLLSERTQLTEEGPGTVESLGLSFTDITSVLTSSYRSLRSTNNTGHVGVQSVTPDSVKSLSMVDLDCTV